MYFKAALIEKILSGEKIQTRRPVKAGEVLRQQESPHGGYVPIAVVQNGRKKYAVGSDYAVCEGRGKPCVWWRRDTFPDLYEILWYEDLKDVADMRRRGYQPMRILINRIQREDVRNISHEDAIAEGFQSRAEFLATWCSFYDARVTTILQKDGVVLWVDGAGVPYASDVVDFPAWLTEHRPAELYQAWVYWFEVLR